MGEYGSATPPRYVGPEPVNVTDDMFDNAARRPDHPGFARNTGTGWRPVSCAEFADQVTRLAAGLLAEGIQPGDRIALMSSTSYEWALCDFAIMAVGAVTVPIYETSSPAQVEWILSDSGAVAGFVQDDRLHTVVRRAAPPGVRKIWRMDGDRLARLTAAGAAVPAAAVAERRRAVTAGQLATIVYTSGTTGRPKGCRISHRSLVSEVRNLMRADRVSDTVLTDRSSLLLFLPLAHIFARVVQLAVVHRGARLGHVGDLRAVPAELLAFRPTILLAVPRVFEKLYHTAQQAAAARRLGRLFRAAERTAVGYSEALDAGVPGAGLRLRRWLYDRLVYARLRGATGGRVSYAVCAGAPLDARLGHFLRGAGITVLEGYGLTETTAGVTLNLPGAQRIGTVGRPLPGCAVRIADDGEVLVKSAWNFDGYWGDDRATADAFTADGWLRTGDLGSLADGYLTITGRKKEVIVTSGGKNIAPAYYEQRLAGHWLIDHCVVIGNNRPYVGALITLDPAAFSEWKRKHGKPEPATVAEIRDDPALLATVQAAVDEVNQTVSRAEAIRRFRIVPGEFAVGDELTPTQKVRRERVLAKHADEVAALYR
ncbi:MAG TPA: AMP-dependent synthetase/ligase [Natronosporangium sp.]